MPAVPRRRAGPAGARRGGSRIARMRSRRASRSGAAAGAGAGAGVGAAPGAGVAVPATLSSMTSLIARVTPRSSVVTTAFQARLLWRYWSIGMAASWRMKSASRSGRPRRTRLSEQARLRERARETAEARPLLRPRPGQRVTLPKRQRPPLPVDHRTVLRDPPVGDLDGRPGRRERRGEAGCLALSPEQLPSYAVTPPATATDTGCDMPGTVWRASRLPRGALRQRSPGRRRGR